MNICRRPRMSAARPPDNTLNSVDLDRRLPDSELIIYPDAGRGGVFQHHTKFVPAMLKFLAG